MTKQNQNMEKHEIALTFLGSNLKVKSVVLAILLGVLVGAPFTLFSTTQKAGPMDKLADFQEAAKEEGCKAIPYQRERIECDNRSKAKDNTCKNFACNREDVQKDIDELKDNMRKLENAERYNDRQSVDNLKPKIQKLKEKLEEQVKSAKDRVDVCEDCLEARENVQRIFSDVKKMVEDERDADLQPYIPVLVRKFQEGREKHDKDPTREVIQAWDNCRWVRDLKVDDIKP